MTKRMLSLALALALVLSLFAGISVTGSSLCLKPETEVLALKVRRAAELISAKL